jgi:hypothetical protein
MTRIKKQWAVRVHAMPPAVQYGSVSQLVEEGHGSSVGLVSPSEDSGGNVPWLQMHTSSTEETVRY